MNAPTTRPRHGAIARGCLLALLLVAGAAGAQRFDPEYSRVGFELRTLWGQTLEGVFPSYEGEVVELDDGHRRVRLRLHTAQVEISGHPHYTNFARGERFFDVAQYPYIEFVSAPYRKSLLQTGGDLHGRLRMLGVEHEEVFTLEPAGCARPGLDCDVVSHGVVDRDAYGLDGWSLAIRDEVRFTLRMRLLATTP